MDGSETTSLLNDDNLSINREGLILYTSTEEQSGDESVHTQYNDNYNYTEISTLLIIRIMVDFVFKNPLIFWDNYSNGLKLTSFQFAYILIGSEFGCIIALFLGEINILYFKLYSNIMIIYLIICGIASIMIPISIYLYDSTIFVIIWCCIFRFIVGLSFASISAASIKYASQTVEYNKVSTIIAILHYSWPLSTILNIFAGYIIDDESWIYVFIISGVSLIIIAIFSKILFLFANNSEIVNVSDANSETDGLFTILTDTNSILIIFSSFFMSLRSRTIYVVTASLWMEEIFNLNAIDVGYASISIIIGEVLALLIVAFFTHKYELWKSAVFALSFQFMFGGLLLFILSLIFGNNMVGSTYNESIIIALIMICLLTFGHESFYVIQQSNAIYYAPKQSISFLLLLAERMSQEIAAMIALLLTATLWYLWKQDAILIFSIIWMIATLFESSVLYIYRNKNNT